MSHDRLAAEMPRPDVLVVPSFFDSFGMVVAEAMACGLPVVVTQNVGAKEMISPGVNGLIVPAGDAGALADAMRLVHQESRAAPGNVAGGTGIRPSNTIGNITVGEPSSISRHCDDRTVKPAPPQTPGKSAKIAWHLLWLSLMCCIFEGAARKWAVGDATIAGRIAYISKDMVLAAFLLLGAGRANDLTRIAQPYLRIGMVLLAFGAVTSTVLGVEPVGARAVDPHVFHPATRMLDRGTAFAG